MPNFLDSAAAKAERKAKKGAAGFAAALLVGVGLGFLTVAAWLVLAQMQGPIFAATILGCAYAGLGISALGLLAFNGPARRASPPAPQPQDLSIAAVMEAFLVGMSAGQRTRGSKGQ